MDDGLYETLITQRAQRNLAEVADRAAFGPVDDGDQPHVLARHIGEVVRRHLEGIKDLGDRIRVANEVLGSLEADEQVDAPPRQLLSVRSQGFRHVDRAGRRPRTPLSDAALLTNAPDEPSLAAELKAEISSADSVDLLCAFVKWYGMRLLEDELLALKEAGRPLRILTTTYLGSTERRALDWMIREFDADVRIQYDSQRTRLHAKAWLFRRRTGFDTAYVGSSNLSRAALLDGVEWNVRLSKVSTPSLMNKFEATFDSYWSDGSFEPYHPDRDGDRLDDALLEAGGRVTSSRTTISLAGLEVRPFPHQSEILDSLNAERVVHDRHKNLIVAATGTGKTVVAALDYRRLREDYGDLSLLFVAHRKEILDQSLRTYREVLADANFGEQYVGGARPERWRHVFSSVQSLTSYGVENIPKDHFDVVVIDEFHHAEAKTYRKLLDHLEPGELLGLTATPERADGVDVRKYFDGRTAAELRLWDALGADLLCPFHYFGVADGTDLRMLTWSRGRYDETELGNLYTGNRARVAIILAQLRDKVLNTEGMRALGFCVNIAHAEFMADQFRAAGIAARALSQATKGYDRDQALADLRECRVNILFAVDLFNEGLDVPDVDTVLFLRPTESATVFLQQLGRGLRRTSTKAVLTILDFVGHQSKQFRFDQKFRALTEHTRAGIIRDIEHGFPFLPPGCQIVLDRQSEKLILENIKSQTAQRWSSMISELRSCGDVDLKTFLDESGVDLADVLKEGRRSWTELRRAANLATGSGGRYEDYVLKRVRSLVHVDDARRVNAYCRLLDDDGPQYASLSGAEQRLAKMLFFTLWPNGGGHSSYDEGLAHVRREHAGCGDIRAVIDLAFDATRHAPIRLSGELEDVPLQVHARYQREEILAALDYANSERSPSTMREGVVYIPDRNIDAFLVTLRKSEADYSPTTMYRDYPISPTVFHWESQSQTSISSPTGQRYINGESTVLLFARETKRNEYGTAPYLFLGPATYLSHEGERPIAIRWRLQHAMPMDFFTTTSVSAA